VKIARRRLLTVGAFGLLALAVLAAGYLLVIAPQRSKAAKVDVQIATARAQLVSMHATRGRPTTIRAADLFRLARAMPSIDDMAGIVVDLQQLASASKLTLVSIRPAPRVALPNGSSAVPLTVTLDGSWKGLSGFLQRVRQQVGVTGSQISAAGRLFDVDNLQVTSQPKPIELEAVLTMNAFDYGAPPSPTATAGASNGTTTGTTTTTGGSGAQAAGTTGSGS